MKEYTNSEITVYWDPDKCIHSRKCVNGLPQVFDRNKKPWINMQGSDSEEIMKVIDRCPSGALSYKKSETIQKPSAEIKVTKNGPLLVKGNCVLIDCDDNEIASCGPFALCRCGGSKKKPFCDGTHSKIGFDDSF
ncbi:MAG: (4Fe-4S)-binding protein [Methanotrichaceae archaeon]